MKNTAKQTATVSRMKSAAMALCGRCPMLGPYGRGNNRRKGMQELDLISLLQSHVHHFKHVDLMKKLLFLILDENTLCESYDGTNYNTI